MAHKTKGRRTWRATWADENGRRHGRSGFPTRVDAERFETEERLTATKVKAGHIQRDKMAATEWNNRPAALHLTDYEEWKIAEAGSNTKHIKNTIAIISNLLSAFDWRRIAEIEPMRIRKLIATYSAATHNHHLTAVRGFTKWLVQHGRLPSDPLATLRRRNTDKDKTFTRVPMTPEMVTKVFKVSIADAHVAYLYRLLSITGLRISEAIGLTTADFDWKQMMVTVLGKSQKIECQPLPTVGSRGLSIWMFMINPFGREPNVPLFPFTVDEARKRFKGDLKRAGITAQKGLDLHSFRHGYITEMARQVVPGGITIEDLRILARHSEITTTAKYLHGTCDGNRGKAVDAAFS